MTLVSPELDELFLVRTTKYHTLNPSQKWSNNYCFEAGLANTTADIEAFAQACLEFERAMVTETVVIERAVVSTFVRDTSPYDGDEFLTVDFGDNGDVAITGTALLPLEACLYLRKNTATGRNGKLFLRGALAESDVEFGQSLFALSSPTTIATRMSAALTSSGLLTYLSAAEDGEAMVIAPTPTQALGARDVTSMSVGGVRFVNLNKRYYDR